MKVESETLRGVVRAGDASSKDEGASVNEERLAQTFKMAELGVMSATIMHELRQPLVAIKTYLEMILLDFGKQGAVDDRLKTVFGHVQELEAMLDGYVSFSRNPSDHVLPLTLDGPVDAALGLLRYRFKERRVNLHRDVEPSLPLVRGNSATLQQVMVNLLVNSLDALSTRTLAETRHIWIKVQRSSDGTQVEAFFADNGTGICPENAPHVFDYFFTTKAEEEGTGLGLPIASKILEAHGGHLTLVEFPAFGKDWNPKPVTTFKMALPALQSSR